MKQLKVAVSGLGRIGWAYHIPQIRKQEGFILTAVADASAERLAEAEQSFGVNTYSDFKQMIQTEELDLVVIASPTIFHMEQAVFAMEHGVDVLLEKPMAGSLDEADTIIATMKKLGRKLMVFQPHRTKPEFLAAKNIIDRNLLGPVYMIKRSDSRYFRRNDWQSLTKYGGGMLNNSGSHYIDQLISLAGSSAKSIASTLKTVASMGDADDVVKMLIETENGITLDLDINQAASIPLPTWILLGKYGAAALEQTDQGPVFRVRYLKEEELPELGVNEELAAPGRTYGNEDQLIWHEEMVRVNDFEEIDFYEKCLDYYVKDENPFVPVEETREVMRIIEECRKMNSSS